VLLGAKQFVGKMSAKQRPTQRIVKGLGRSKEGSFRKGLIIARREELKDRRQKQSLV
jgi:hypothetical protein